MPFPLIPLLGGAAIAAAAVKLQNRKKTSLGETLSGLSFDETPPLLGGLLPIPHQVDAQLQTFAQEHIDPLFGSERAENRQELGLTTELNEAERETNRYLFLPLTALGASVIGLTVFPPLLMGAMAIGLMVTYRAYQQGYEEWQKEKRLKAKHIYALYLTGAWGGGFYIAASVGLLFYTLSEKMVLLTEDKSRRNLISVFGQHPKTVWVLHEGVEIQVPFESLRPGDVVVVNAGELIPSDGIIIKGHASIDQHVLTGEAQPAERGVGEAVLASTVLLAGRIEMRVDKAGEETTAAQIGKILNNATSYKKKLEMEGLELAHKTVVPSLVMSGLTLPLVGLPGAVAMLGSNQAFNMTILGPMSMLNFLNIAAEKGILIKDGAALERLKTIDTVVFDKTGTLTLEQPTIRNIYVQADMTEDELLTLAAAAEYRQTHPIAKAILSLAQLRQLTLPPIQEAQYEVGYGIKVRLEEQVVRVGSYRFMRHEALHIPESLQQQHLTCQAEGYSLVMVAVNNEVMGAIELEPTVRPEAKAVIRTLRERGLELYIISGDQEGPTHKLAETLGMSGYFANVLPTGKAGLIEQLQAKGRRVCFVGDGINDALALKTAEVSISLRGATTAATDTAQIIFMDGTLRMLPHLFTLSQSLSENVKTNFLGVVAGSLFASLGILFLHFGILAVETIFIVSLASGLVVTTKPLLDHKKDNPLLTLN